MKSSLALVIEQLLLLDPFLELHLDVALPIDDDLSLLPLFVSKLAPTTLLNGVHVRTEVAAVAELTGAVEAVVVAEVDVGGLGLSGMSPRGGDVCLGVNNALNGTSGITKSSSLTTTLLLTTNAPTLMVSLNDLDISSLK